MKYYYAITVQVTFGVLAETTEEAEEIARGMIDLSDIPLRANESVDAQMTLNQNDYIKRGAVNYE